MRVFHQRLPATHLVSLSLMYLRGFWVSEWTKLKAKLYKFSVFLLVQNLKLHVVKKKNLALNNGLREQKGFSPLPCSLSPSLPFALCSFSFFHLTNIYLTTTCQTCTVQCSGLQIHWGHITEVASCSHAAFHWWACQSNSSHCRVAVSASNSHTVNATIAS